MEGVYEMQVRHYTLEKHTCLVLGQFGQYFAKSKLPISPELFRFMLTVHDIGKAQAARERCLANQYGHTLRMIDQLRPEIPFTGLAVDCCLKIIEGDPLGGYLKGETTSQLTVEQIKQLARETYLSVPDFFWTLTIYYQCDAGAYTKDAGGLPFLEKLFTYKDGLKQLDQKRKILCFSPNLESKYQKLEMALA